MEMTTQSSSSTSAKLLSVNDLTEYFQVTRQTIAAWRKKPDFPQPIQLGKFLRWKPSEIEKFLENCSKH